MFAEGLVPPVFKKRCKPSYPFLPSTRTEPSGYLFPNLKTLKKKKEKKVKCLLPTTPQGSHLGLHAPAFSESCLQNIGPPLLHTVPGRVRLDSLSNSQTPLHGSMDLGKV